MVINIDAKLHNADWLRQRWTLPPYKSEEFFARLENMDITLSEFKELPIYERAVKQGLIKNDQWVSNNE